MKYRFKTLLLLLPLAALLLPSTGCDSATNPLAPAGTVITVTANPTKISLSGGTSTITVTGFRPDGNPLNTGTQLSLTTDLGTLSTNVISVDAMGRGTAVLAGDGRTGAATVTITLLSDSSVTATATVQVEEERPQLEVSANPSTIPVLGRSTITVLARDDDGFFLEAGRTIILTSDLGSVPQEVETDASGRATFTFRAGEEGGTGTVTAILDNSEPATVNIEIRDAVGDLVLQINPNSVDRVDDNTETVTLQAFVRNAQGNPLPNVNVTFDPQRGTLNAVTDLTDNNGIAQVTLTVRASDVADIPADGTFTVTATAISEGDSFSDTKTITVRGAP